MSEPINNTVIESLHDDHHGGEFWWKHCSVDGCKNMENRAAATGKCHVHTYTSFKHKIARMAREAKWRILNG